ncbi:Pyridoxal kinase [Apostasia shenzhenica]|uniref:pyridoxal kinase n=1 Tax=Apostasia shenzhenica TaxID=1088818 RepID=A0A2I0AF33_9ASPA|nr:Pyridoxal kinase [Apostasia shenzhenica]
MALPPILSLALPSQTGRVLSIQSHTVQGYVGNKSAVFPLQLLGYDVDPINSVQFSNHTGYPTFRGQVLDGKELWDLIEGLGGNNLLYYTHLLTGYIGSISFLDTILQVVQRLRMINPQLIYVCDPVMGDEGKLYVPKELVSVYREQVVPVASMLTPNQFEIEQLTGYRISSEKDGLEACNKLHAAGPKKVIITSICIQDNFLLIGSHQKEECAKPLRFNLQGMPPEQFKIVIPKIPAYFTLLNANQSMAWLFKNNKAYSGSASRQPAGHWQASTTHARQPARQPALESPETASVVRARPRGQLLPAPTPPSRRQTCPPTAAPRLASSRLCPRRLSDLRRRRCLRQRGSAASALPIDTLDCRRLCSSRSAGHRRRWSPRLCSSDCPTLSPPLC